MRVYNYNEVTGVLLFADREFFADPDPMTPGEWIVPGYSTKIEPPEIPEGKQAVFDVESQTWNLQDVPAPAETTPAVGNSTPEELGASVSDKRDMLLQTAALRIAPLQDAVDLGEATEAEAASLLAWKKFRIDANRVTEQEGYPQTVTWPALPGAVEVPVTTA